MRNLDGHESVVRMVPEMIDTVIRLLGLDFLSGRRNGLNWTPNRGSEASEADLEKWHMVSVASVHGDPGIGSCGRYVWLT